MRNKFKKVLFYFISCTLVLVFLELTLILTSHLLQIPQYLNNLTDNQKNVILTLGESTTADLYSADGTSINSWPQILKKKLIAKEYPTRIINTAIPGTNSKLILSQLISNIEKYKPTLIIAMIGVNDMQGGNQFLYSPEKRHSLRIVNLISSLIKYKFNSIKILDDSEDIFKEVYDLKDREIVDHLRDQIKKNQKDLSVLEDINDERFFNTLFWDFFPSKSDPNLSKSDYLTSHNIMSLAIKKFPHRAKLFENISYTYIAQNKFLECHNDLKMFMLENNTSTPILFNHFEQCSLQGEETRKDVSILFPQLKDAIFVQGEHHRRLFEITKEYGIPLVLVQYPTRDVNVLKGYFKNKEKNLYFVSNKENFAKALQDNEYDKIFYDHFGITFGHATKFGNTILADQILEKLLNKKLVEKN